MSESKTIPQMTIKKLDVDPREAFATKSPSMYLCRIFGQATGIKTKEARSGDPYSYLVGEFSAVNNKGEAFDSEKLFLPASIQESVESQLKAANGAAVRFGYDIFACYDDKVSVGYRYAAKAVVKTEASNVIAEMAKELANIPLPNAPQQEQEQQAPEAPKPVPVTRGR